jgi:hypothetical protein
MQVSWRTCDWNGFIYLPVYQAWLELRAAQADLATRASSCHDFSRGLKEALRPDMASHWGCFECLHSHMWRSNLRMSLYHRCQCRVHLQCPYGVALRSQGGGFCQHSRWNWMLYCGDNVLVSSLWVSSLKILRKSIQLLIFFSPFIIRKKYMEESYKNQPSEDYFKQFNTRSR